MIPVPYKRLLKFSCFAAISEITYYALRELHSKFVKASNEEILYKTSTFKSTLRELFETEDCDYVNEVLLFPDPGISCPKEQIGRVCRDQNCVAIHRGTSLGSVVKILRCANKTLDICVYLITSNILGDILVECHNRGVIVRVITDDRNSGEQGEVSSAQVGKFRAAGIQVLTYSASFWMHHKFAIIDSELILTGSLNWTNQAALGNLENVIVSTNPQLVTPYIEEFQKIYDQLKPEKN